MEAIILVQVEERQIEAYEFQGSVYDLFYNIKLLIDDYYELYRSRRIRIVAIVDINFWTQHFMEIVEARYIEHLEWKFRHECIDSIIVHPKRKNLYEFFFQPHFGPVLFGFITGKFVDIIAEEIEAVSGFKIPKVEGKDWKDVLFSSKLEQYSDDESYQKFKRLRDLFAYYIALDVSMIDKKLIVKEGTKTVIEISREELETLETIEEFLKFLVRRVAERISMCLD